MLSEGRVRGLRGTTIAAGVQVIRHICWGQIAKMYVTIIWVTELWPPKRTHGRTAPFSCTTSKADSFGNGRRDQRNRAAHQNSVHLIQSKTNNQEHHEADANALCERI